MINSGNDTKARIQDKKYFSGCAFLWRMVVNNFDGLLGKMKIRNGFDKN